MARCHKNGEAIHNPNGPWFTAVASAYGVLMTLAARSMVAATYVRDIETSRAFYELLGFREHSAGRASTSGWLALHQNGLFVLLASTRPSLDIPQLPLLFYFFYDDVDAVVSVLGAAGVPVTRTGHPPHALGGEVKVEDPDGNTVLLGQRERSASQAPAADNDTSPRFSLLREAAALVAAQGGTEQRCQAHDRQGNPCPNQADLKLADALGDAAWVCMEHADEILMTVPAAFIASQEGRGIVAFLSGQPRHR
jgi:catechol 2,3-dioxygenase-like lactoylglutathione lyase family enzyme